MVGFLSVALILLCVSFVGALQNEPEGFRGLKWGEPPTENMKYLGTANLRKAYELPDDKMSIGNAKFYLVTYSFYDEPQRFAGVLLCFKGEKNYDLLETICKSKFGEDEMEKNFYELTWYGQTSFIVLKYYMVEEKGFLSISSAQIEREVINAQKQKETKEAEGDW